MWQSLKLRRLQRRRRQAAGHTTSEAFRELLNGSLERLAEPWDAQEFLVADLETTGLDPARDHLIALGWVPVIGGRIHTGEARRLIVQSPEPMNQSAAIHGLRDVELAEGTTLETALDAFIRALTGRCLVVHYAGLDKALLDRLCREHYGAPLLVPCVDTLQVAMRSLRIPEPQENQFRLGVLRDRFGLPPVSQHDALTDAYATAELFLVLCDRLDGRRTVTCRRLLA